MSRGDVTIKMCGLRSVVDVDAACDAGADILGLVLVPGARRCVDPETANAMVARARERGGAEVVAVVGGDIDPPAAAELVRALGVDAVQLVGDDDRADAVARDLDPATRIIRTLAASSGNVSRTLAQASVWENRGARVIFEPHVDGALGGSGVAFNVDVSRRLMERAPRGIAGGLTPENVAAVIRDVAPALVDVSSGIEIDGTKDPHMMRRFAEAARGATQ